MSDYERLLSDLREMNEHGMRESTSSALEAVLTANTFIMKAEDENPLPMRWKIMYSEPHDKSGKYWIVLEGQVPNERYGGQGRVDTRVL